MPTFAVRFKGMLTKDERKRLEQARIRIKDQEPSLQIGFVKTGVPIYTTHVAGLSEDEALRKVREALDPDTANFSGWEVRQVGYAA
jgi:hypothetical protein